MFVAPKTVIISQRVENAVSHDGVVRAAVKYIEAQHVSVQSTIAMKLKNQRFRDAIFEKQSQQLNHKDGTFVWYQDGDTFKEQTVVVKYQAPNAIVIDIQLYTDGLHLTNHYPRQLFDTFPLCFISLF
jgi:ribosomal protein S4E